MITLSLRNRGFLLAALAACFAFPARAGTVYVNAASTAASPDGQSWATAFKDIADAVQAAQPGDEVWAAKGVYRVSLSLKTGVGIYGGFAGSETNRANRDVRGNATVLDGDAGNVVVNSGADVSSGAVLEGFTIRNAVSGVICDASSPVIRRNTFWKIGRPDVAPADAGGAITCRNGANPRIENNVLFYNRGLYGSAVHISGSSPVIVNNTMVRNVNNTPGPNDIPGASAVFMKGAAAVPLFVNNIIGYGSGIVNDAANPAAPAFRNNCFIGNNEGPTPDFMGLPNPTGSDGNISDTPDFVDLQHMDVHIQPTSPCVGAGDISVVIPGSQDMDGQLRVYGRNVDIGADESYGESRPRVQWNLHVSTTGNDFNDGLTWGTAKRSVAEAGVYAGGGDEIWVAAGAYPMTSARVSGAAVYGGFAGTETAREQRNPSANITTLSGGYGGAVLTLFSAAAADGFTITRPLISSTGYAPGIHAFSMTGAISNNRITGHPDSGIMVNGGAPLITRNRITGNRAARGGGISVLYGGKPRIADNDIVGNVAVGLNGLGGAVWADAASAPVLANNTIVGNRAGSGGAVNAPSATLANNIIGWNSSGAVLGAGSTVSHNILFENNGQDIQDIQGIPAPDAALGNLFTDPLLASVFHGDLRLLPGSPAINAGDNAAVNAGETDADGQPRIRDGRVDIGARESDGGPVSPALRIVRVLPDGDDANDGSSWTSAMKTVQAALNRVVEGGEVWVGQGTYKERLIASGFVSLYGGFAGTETERAQRNPAANVTILDGARAGTVLLLRGSLFGTVDGFTITNGFNPSGAAASGILCDGSAVTVSNNILTGNSYTAAAFTAGDASVFTNNVVEGTLGASSYSQAVAVAIADSSTTLARNTIRNHGSGSYLIRITGGSPALRNNIITNNTTTNPIFSIQSSAEITGNVIGGNSSNSGYALSTGPSGLVANNTIAANGRGVALGRNVTFVNNIVAWNGSGLAGASGQDLSGIRQNIVYGNTGQPYTNLAFPPGADTNIQADPLLASPRDGNYHIQPNSPAVDAGDDSVVRAGDVDMDGQPRIQGAHVDIGADESDGTEYGPFSIHVKPDGDDTADGRTWDTAKKTVRAAMSLPTALGPLEIWVAAGIYKESVVLPTKVSLYGGFNGTETRRDQRDWRLNETVLEAVGNSVSVVTATTGADALMDGFAIRPGAFTNTRGVYLNNASPTLRNNTITDHRGGGINLYRSSPIIAGNVISNNTATAGGGIYWDAVSSPVVTGNTFRGNTAKPASGSAAGLGGAIYMGGAGVVSGNTFTENTATNPLTPAGNGGAIYAVTLPAQTVIESNSFRGNAAGLGAGVYAAGKLTVANSVFLGNRAATNGGGLYLTGASNVASGNTFTGNSATMDGGAVHLNTAARLANNLIGWNSSGVAAASGVLPVMISNDLWQNSAYNVKGFADPVGQDGNRSVDPKIASFAYGNVHLQPDSPLVDAGNPAEAAGTLDMDGQPRVQGARVDIGADESNGTVWSAAPDVIRVRPGGDDAGDGKTWGTAKKTIAAAQNALSPGGEIWVAAGTYHEAVTLREFQYLYGGFSGTETTREARDPRRHATTLDGNGRSVGVLADGVQHAVLDGFTVHNALVYGISLRQTTIRVSNNTVIGTASPSPSQQAGYGIYISGGSPEVVQNRVIGSDLAGIYADRAVAPRIANNLVTENGTNMALASVSGGIIVAGAGEVTNNTIARNGGNGLLLNSYGGAMPAAANNIVYGGFNGVAFYPPITGFPPDSFHNNLVFGNTQNNYTGAKDPTGLNGNLGVDPLLANPDGGNFHIQSNSPAVDAGDDSVVLSGDVDMDGQPRIHGAHVDIGADESDGTDWSAHPTIIRVRPDGSDANDGNTWTGAKESVQAALNALGMSGGEVWVAAGTYAENLSLPLYARLYGGFAGTETTRDARNWAANMTIIDGGARDSVVLVARGSINAVVDGFTIRNGRAGKGAGIQVLAPNFEVAHNVLTGNVAIKTPTANPNIMALGQGPALYAETSGTVHDNLFTGNIGAGGGTAVDWRTSGGGPFRFNNNTVAANTDPDAPTGYALFLSGNMTASNNIIAYNGGGASVRVTTWTHNNVYGNAVDYSGTNPSGSNGNLTVDPRFVDRAAGNFRLAADSQLVDAGDDAAVAPGAQDLDGVARIRGLHVDMGTYESAGTRLPETSPRQYVRPDGNDTADGSSWAAARRTIGTAVSNVRSPGGEVWLAAGTYTENVVLPVGVGLYGGFSGTESELSARNPAANVTVIDGGQRGSAAIVTAGAGLDTVVDGLTIRNGNAATGYGGGIRILDTASPTIRNNILDGNAATYGAAISVGQASHTLIENNRFAGVQSGTLIYSRFATPTIAGNRFSGGSGTGAITVDNGAPVITDNTIERGGSINLTGANSTVLRNRLTGGMGVRVSGGTIALRNNVIMGGPLGPASPLAVGGLYLNNTSGVVANNTIAGFRETGISNSPNVTIVNNIVAYNGQGIEGAYRQIPPRNNNVFGNLVNYVSMDNVTGTDGNISLEPRFADFIAGDLHISADSPCVDAGDNAVVPAGDTDMDGQPRIQGVRVDIGADENDGTAYPPPPAVVYVRPGGDDANDGASWETAKQSIAAAALLIPGREIRVAEGVYSTPVLVTMGARLYGGFSGTETSRDQRDPAAHATVISGGFTGGAAAIQIMSGAQGTVVDGFTLPAGGITARGNASLEASNNKLSGGITAEPGVTLTVTRSTLTGVGITLGSGGQATLLNNRIQNSPTGAITANQTSLTARNNLITDNGTYTSDAAVSVTQGTVDLTNNTIVGNRGAKGAVSLTGAQGVMTNNIVAYNQGGVYTALPGTGSVLFDHNDIYGNGAFDQMNLPAALTGTNVSTDPGLVSAQAGDYRLQAYSALIDAGSDAAVKQGDSDLGDGPRILGSHVDIGAFESDGRAIPVGPRVLRVSPSGDDASDGSSWSAAKHTIQAALAEGGEVWVAQGVYAGPFQVGRYSSLYGGFAGTEARRDDRNPNLHETVLEGDKTAPVVSVVGSIFPTAVDGFTIRPFAGAAGAGYVAGIKAENAAITVANNRLSVTANAIELSNCQVMVFNNVITTTSSAWGYGIRTTGSGTGLVAGNTISDYPYGIVCANGPYTIYGNIVRDLEPDTGADDVIGIGIYPSPYLDNPRSEISNNLVTRLGAGSRVPVGATGIISTERQVRVANNVVTKVRGSTVAWGITVDSAGQDTLILNNTVSDVTGGQDDSAGVRALAYTNKGLPLVVNNIMAFSTVGLRSAEDGVQMSNNIFWSNPRHYIQYDHQVPPVNSLILDPQFTARVDGDYHVSASSPAVNAGDNSVVTPDDRDLDFYPRIGGGRVDIGAYEFYAVAPVKPDPVRVLRIAGGLDTAVSTDAGGGLTFPLDIVDAVRAARDRSFP